MTDNNRITPAKSVHQHVESSFEKTFYNIQSKIQERQFYYICLNIKCQHSPICSLLLYIEKDLKRPIFTQA